MRFEETDVVIVGAGVPGLVLASEVFRRGLSACVLEHEAGSARSRGVLLQPAALDALARIELYSRIRAGGAAIERILLHAAGQSEPAAVLDYADAGEPFPLALGVTPDAVLAAAIASFERFRAVRIERGVELLSLHREHGRVAGAIARGPSGDVTYRGHAVLVTTVSGGAPIRAEIGAAARVRPYPEEQLALSLPRPRSWGDDLRVWLGAGMGVVAYPISAARIRVETTAAGGILTGARMGGADALRRLLEPVAPQLAPALATLATLADAPLSVPARSQLKHRVGDGVALVGPAALSMSPLGFGADTQAVLDAARLAEVLSRCMTSRDFSRLAMRPYETARDRAAQRAAALAHDFHRLVVGHSRLSIRARRLVLERLGESPALRRQVLRLLAGLDEAPLSDADRLRLGGLPARWA